MYHVCIHVILFQSVNKFPFHNKTALKYIHTFVTGTSMTAFDHNFNSQGQLLNYCPKGVNHSQNNTTVIFLTFGISPQFFVISLIFYHKVIPSKDADRNAKQL